MTETGTQNVKPETAETESFDMFQPRLAPDIDRSTFEPLYAGPDDHNTLPFMPLFDDGAGDGTEDGAGDGTEDGAGDEEKADGIVKEVKKRASLIESEAYEKGFAQGEKDGFEMGSKKFEKIVERIHGTLQDMLAYRQEFAKRYENEILHLICAIAGKVVRGAIKVDNEVVRETILDAFSLAADRSEVTVRVNPEDVEYLKELRPEFFDRIKELRSFTIESDPSITRGGCFMETAFGKVDACIETQLEKIGKAVEDAFGEERVAFANRERK
jgi:flagellar assembly protein FliH